MARWRVEQEPLIPDWVRHEHDGGFAAADWAEPGDFGVDPRVAESRAHGRWVKARLDYLNEHPDVADLLLEQLRALAQDTP